MININFFGALREQLHCNEAQLNTSSPVTVAQARDLLIEQFPEWKSKLNNNTLISAVNHEVVQDDFVVDVNDELAFFPPVTGG